MKCFNLADTRHYINCNLVGGLSRCCIFYDQMQFSSIW